MKRKLDKKKIKSFIGQTVVIVGFHILSTVMLIYGVMTATTLNQKGGKKVFKIFNNIKLIIENNNLKKENEAIKEENEKNRNDIAELDFKAYKAKRLAEHTLTQLVKLEEINRSGNSEETKTQNRNIIINDLRKQNINIIKELEVGKTYQFK